MKEHLFQPGKSGNPAGKPKGAQDKRLVLRRMLEARGPEVVETLLDMAIVDRDPVALKLIMERISPRPKADSVNLGIQVNSVNGKDDIRAIVSEVLLGAIKGEVPDDQGKSISALVKTFIDVDNDKRMDDLEAKLGIKDSTTL
jgi:hypothetical protein